MTRLFLISVFSLLFIWNLRSQEIKAVSSAEDIKVIFNKAKGNVILLNFWATWCKPCVTEFPELIKLYKNYKDKGFELVFISLDDKQDIDSKLKPFLKKQSVDFLSYYSTFTNAEELIDYIDKNWQGAIPSTYIYDREGNLKVSILGTQNYEQFEKEIIPLLD
ncbi:MAG: TlpA family protein disulfide reductase [Chlorobi bacterium]|nr:TlpA family protein disulfide reductase [Chlorobiota bacterium]